MMDNAEWHIYVGEIPYSPEGNFWVSFESDPGLKKTKANIYGRCLPCIQNLYHQLQEGRAAITLGDTYNCWKVTAVLGNVDECLALLGEFEHRFPGGHVYGKFGSGRPGAKTLAVVFHAESEAERDRLQEALSVCLAAVSKWGEMLISKGCAVLYDDLLGDWRNWEPTTPIRHPENRERVLERVKKVLFTASM